MGKYPGLKRLRYRAIDKRSGALKLLKVDVGELLSHPTRLSLLAKR